MTCQGLCVKYCLHPDPPRDQRYKNGNRRCTSCEVYYNGRTTCPCCNNVLRAKPRRYDAREEPPRIA